MPMYMDIHEIKGATAEDVAKAHRADMETQKKYGVEYHKYWLNESCGKMPLQRAEPRRSRSGTSRGARPRGGEDHRGRAGNRRGVPGRE